MKLNKGIAEDRLREADALATVGTVDEEWQKKIEAFSSQCAESIAKTHIAFLATSILAKAIDRSVDLRAIKPAHAGGNAKAYSARTLCHTVLVPLSAELGFSLGVTGREPLNNQPYFRMRHLGDGTPVHSKAKAAFAAMLNLVDEVAALSDEVAATRVLAAFIAVRRSYQPDFGELLQSGDIAPTRLIAAITQFVSVDSEGGRRAQAVVAGLLDVCFGFERVQSGRINDPSRHYPGDVAVTDATEPDTWERSFEVRDKEVSESDAYIFGSACLARGVREAALVLVSSSQKPLDLPALTSWAEDRGLGFTVFRGWPSFVQQALFWSASPKPTAASEAAAFIQQRLVEVEASPESVALWAELVQSCSNIATHK